MSATPPLSAEEKRRILRERRQAKMAKGQATDRLNSILGSGSSVKANQAVSVLDKETEEGQQPPKSAPASLSGSSTTAFPNSAIHGDVDPEADPEVVDINTLENGSEQQDIDDIFKSLLQHSQAHGNGANEVGGETDPLSQMMMNMLGGGSAGSGNSADPFGLGASNSPFGSGPGSPFGAPDPEQAQYDRDVVAYNLYQQKQWKVRFLVVRFLSVLINFGYHFLTVPGTAFRAGSHSYIRGYTVDTPVSSFITWFSTVEIAILASFYIISTQKNLFKNANDNSWILKGLSFGSMVLPQVAQYRPLVVRLLGYYELLGMFVGDLSLVVVLFGLLSFK